MTSVGNSSDVKTEKILRTTLVSIGVDHPVDEDTMIFVANPTTGEKEDETAPSDGSGSVRGLRSLRVGDSLQVGDR